MGSNIRDTDSKYSRKRVIIVNVHCWKKVEKKVYLKAVVPSFFGIRDQSRFQERQFFPMLGVVGD